MALSEGDKNTIKEIGRELVKEVLSEHIKTCPHGQTIMMSKMLIVGMCIGSGVASGGVVITVMKLIFAG